MFWRSKSKPVTFDGLQNVVWCGRAKESEREITQWADPEFYAIWEEEMQEAFDLLGMTHRFEDMVTESGHKDFVGSGLAGFIPIPGEKNRHLWRRTMLNIDGAATTLTKSRIGDNLAVCWHGRKDEALVEWRSLSKMLAQTSMVAIATPGLRYYVQGTLVGYSAATRHLFKRSNTLEHLGTPNELRWRAHMSGYTVDLIGAWDEIRSVRRTSGLTIFSMFQLQLNEELEKAISMER